MSASIHKEIRSLAPVLLLTLVATTVASLLFIGRDAPGWIATIFGLCCLIMGANSIGNEFQSRTMLMLLAQPRGRHWIWVEKMALLGLALALTYGATLLSVWFFVKEEARPGEFDKFAYGLMAMPILVLCTTPFLTLLSRNVIGGITFSLGLPLLIWMLVMAADWLLSRNDPRAALVGYETPLERHPEIYAVVTGAIYGGLFCWLGYRKFMRLEVIEGQGQEIALPVKLENLLGKALRWLVPGYTGPVASLIRKELQLQRASFIVAGLTCVLLACETVAWFMHKSDVTDAFLAGTLVIYAILVPFLTGSVCMAEEWNWGVAAAQYTLPVSATKRGLIKLLVTYGVCIGLGVALPMFLLWAGRHWFGMTPASFGGMKSSEWLYWSHYYLVVFSLTVYASSISRTAIRALVTAIGMLAGIGALFSLIIYAVKPLGIEEYRQEWVLEHQSSWLVQPIVEGGPPGGVLALVWLFLLVLGCLTFRNIRKGELAAGLFRRIIAMFGNKLPRRIALTGAVVAVTWFTAWLVLRDRGPIYEGKHLSEWLKAASTSENDSLKIQAADNAVRGLGTNALPYLAKMADSSWTSRRVEALGGMMALGRRAKPMIPLLVRLLGEPELASKYQSVSAAAASVLAQIGVDGIAPLTNALAHADSRLKVWIIIALGRYADLESRTNLWRWVDVTDEELPAAQDSIVPVLLDQLKDTNSSVVRLTAYSLGNIHRHPEKVVPELIRLLRKPLPDGPQGTLEVLGRYGKDASAAVPDILKELEAKDRHTAEAATNALKRIDPEMAAKMGIR